MGVHSQAESAPIPVYLRMISLENRYPLFRIMLDWRRGQHSPAAPALAFAEIA